MSTQSSPLHVIIVGGGATGLLLAHRLKKAQISFTVFEQDPNYDARPRDWNFGIYWARESLSHCLPEELDALLPTAQIDNHIPIENDMLPVYNGETGKIFDELPSPNHFRFSRRRFVKLIGTGIHVQFRRRIVNITSDDSEVTVIFDDGSKTTGDLVVGCDGAHSRVREFLVGTEKAAVTELPIAASIAITKLPATAIELVQGLHKRFNIWLHPKGYFVWCGRQDSYDIPNPEDWHFAIGLTWPYEGQTNLTGDAILEDLKRRGREFSEPMSTIIQSIPDGNRIWHFKIGYWIPTFWDNKGGRVTLAGDAAHPMPFHRGQGLNTAINDVVTLGDKLSLVSPGTGELLSTVIDEYEADLRVRGKVGVEEAVNNSVSMHNWETVLQSPLFQHGMYKRAADMEKKRDV